MELSKTFATDQFGRALESWAWLDLSSKTPAFTSLFGDVFFRSDDGWWYLDILEATLTRPWATEAELAAELATQEGEDRYLLGGLARSAHARGVVLEPDQVYDFRVPPILGGAVDVENIDAVDFVVAVNLAGQLHEQVRDLPGGTPIDEIKLEQR